MPICRSRLAGIIFLILSVFTASDTRAAEAKKGDSEFGVPTKAQLEWADLEFGMFTHLGPRKLPDNLTYEKFNADVLVDCAVAMGARYVLVVAKHNDGFTWFQTKTKITRGIQLTPYKGGKGDVVGEIAAACRKRKLGLAIYLCPADATAKARDGGITEDPARQEAYYTEYLGKLTEVCTNYGPLVELWFDGGINPDLFERIRKVVMQFQPKAVCYQGPVNSARWIGNEHGVAPLPYWNRIAAEDHSRFSTKLVSGTPRGAFWVPAESDTPLQGGWRGGKPRNLETLVKLYYETVGHGSQLTLNVAPEVDGSVDPLAQQRARELGIEIRRAIGSPLASTRSHQLPMVLNLARFREIDHLIVQEDLRHGENVLKHRIEGLTRDGWKTLAEGENIGHKRIYKIEPIEVSQVKVTITDSLGSPTLRNLAVTRTGVTAKLSK